MEPRWLTLDYRMLDAWLSVYGAVQALYDPMEEMQELANRSGRKGCAFCGGLGHRIADCPKLASQTREKARSKKDFFGSGGFGAEV